MDGDPISHRKSDKRVTFHNEITIGLSCLLVYTPGRIAECAEDTDFSRECLARLMTCLLSGLAIVNPRIVKGRLFLIVLYFFLEDVL